MKKLLVSVAALALVFTLPSASVYAQGLVEIGVKGGVNLGNAWGDDVDIYTEGLDKKMRMGGAFGGFLIYSINDNFAIQPELLYSMKGIKAEGELEIILYDPYTYEILGYDYVDGTGTIKLSYLEIPVLAKIAIPTQGSVKPVLIIGPALAIKLSAEAELEVEEYSELSGTEDISDDVSGFDFGLVIGAGADVLLASGTLTFDARYTLGLMDVPDVEEVDLAVKNAVISFMVGYAFALQ